MTDDLDALSLVGADVQTVLRVHVGLVRRNEGCIRACSRSTRDAVQLATIFASSHSVVLRCHR